MKTPGKRFTKTNIYSAFCGTNISSTKISLKIKPINSTEAVYEIVMRNPFSWFSISKYVNNGNPKVPISAEIGVHVQGLTSKSGTSQYRNLFFCHVLFDDVERLKNKHGYEILVQLN